MSGARALTAIIPSTAPLRELPDCVATLLKSRNSQDVEIIVAYAADGEVPVEKDPRFAGVDLVRLPGTANLSQVLGAAIARARGNIIAITDATCDIDDNWISAILAAHSAPHPVIGGAVEPAGLRSLADWAGYFIDYGAFMLPLRAGAMRHVPGINISFKRSALGIGEQYVTGEFWKSYWCQELKTQGYELHVDPSMVVFYRRGFSLGCFLRSRFDHGRCFAGMRLRQLSGSERILYLLGAPLLPFLFCARFLRLLLPKQRRMGMMAISFPIIFLGMIFWGIGELCGYLAGAGTSCCRVR